jgi:nucleoside 2-deoxyribosyltransferase
MFKKSLYIASPLFSESERDFNKKIKTILKSFFNVYLPQEDAGLVAEMVGKGVSWQTAGKNIFDLDMEAMKRADIILIVLDGRAIDEGAAFELGYMFALEKQCYGLKTDSRKPFPTGNNPMMQFSCSKIFSSLKELEDWAKGYCHEQN